MIKLGKLFLIIILFPIYVLKSEESHVSDKKFFDNKNSWEISLYYGLYSETDLLPILLRQDTNYRQSYIYTLAFSRPLDYKWRFLDFEFESNLAKHDGLMHHWEWNNFYIAKISEVFQLPLSFSVGEGISLASQNPKLENKDVFFNPLTLEFQRDRIESRNLLNYVMVEMEVGKRDWDFPRVFLRIHHRSGVFGFFCPPDPACGSNFVSYGIRYPLDKLIP
ncbi:MAG: hypothetical protein GW938_10930 [Leptospira sp.]|jgi:hypothetical protein|nr:hypothetical protein [Leptospira sp.]NCS93342.1 hypothetical protein [Leptospira sp.]